MISGEIPLWLVDGNDRIVFVNDAAVRTLGYDDSTSCWSSKSLRLVDEAPGVAENPRYPAEDCPITHATRRGEAIRMERDWWVRKDGSMVPILIDRVQMEIDGRMGTAMTFNYLDRERASRG